MNALEVLWDLLHPLRGLGPPALSQMRLGPEDSSSKCMIQFFTWDSRRPDMSWWKHFENHVPDLQHLGFTQVWLPPPNKAMVQEGRGYDAYDLWDLGEFDQKGSVGTRWGTKDELLHATTVANQHGLDILIDAVLNHKLGADKHEKFLAVPVNPENRLKDIGPVREIEGWTAFEFAGRGNKYSNFKWGHQHFTGVDWDNRSKTKGIYRIAGPGRDGWSKRVDKELGNYDYLLGIDIDHRHPEVAKDLLAWGPWVLETTGAAGFRLDAIKHMDYDFLRQFITTSRQQSNMSKLFAVSEYWSADIKKVLPYIRIFQGLTTFFDVPLHENLHQASKKGSKYDLRKIFNNTIVKLRPGDAVTFVDNHDTQIGQSLESWVYSVFKLQAYALILLRGEGHPCVFYGDLYPNEECYDPAIAQGLRILLKCRQSNVFSGNAVDYWRHKNCIGWVRGLQEKCAVLVSNADKGDGKPHTIKMFVGEGNTIYRNLFVADEEIQTDQKGWGSFTCHANKVAVWVTQHSVLESIKPGLS